MVNKGLDKFVVSKDLSIEEIRDLITPYADFDLEEGTIKFNNEYERAETRIQLLVPLLALQAFKRDEKAGSATMDPVELAEITDNPVGKAYPIIRELEQEGVIENVGKEYRIDPDSSTKIHTQFNSSAQTEVAD